MSRATQRLAGATRDIIDTVPVKAGPFHHEIGGVKFATVLTKGPADPAGFLAVTLVATGQRIARVATLAPKRDGLQLVTKTIDGLVAKHGAAVVGNRIAHSLRNDALPATE